MTDKLRRINNSAVDVYCRQCHKWTTLAFTIQQEQAWREGQYIQNVAPELTPDERELLISGTCGPCFDSLFATAD